MEEMRKSTNLTQIERELRLHFVFEKEKQERGCFGAHKGWEKSLECRGTGDMVWEGSFSIINGVDTKNPWSI